MTLRKQIALGLILGASLISSAFGEGAVGITSSMMELVVTHNAEPLTISRNQDSGNQVKPAFGLTSRPCPPFCIQPIEIAPGVETVGELEVLDYLKRKSDGDDSIIIIDSRTPEWTSRGMIPSAINVPWMKLNPNLGATIFEISDIMRDVYNVLLLGSLFDFSQAKTAILYCNGPWCGQSPANIRTLIRFGYPADKLKWYRGGMQDWELLGLTTVKPAS